MIYVVCLLYEERKRGRKVKNGARSMGGRDLFIYLSALIRSCLVFILVSRLSFHLKGKEREGFLFVLVCSFRSFHFQLISLTRLTSYM